MITKYNRVNDIEYEVLEEHEAECFTCGRIGNTEEYATSRDGNVQFCPKCLRDEYDNLLHDYKQSQKRCAELEKALKYVKQLADSKHSPDFRIGSIRGYVDISLVLI